MFQTLFILCVFQELWTVHDDLGNKKSFYENIFCNPVTDKGYLAG